MTQGRLVYSQLSAAISDIAKRLSTQQRELAAINQQQTDVNKSLSDQYKRLAGFYLAEIDADRLDKHFDSTATQVAALQGQRNQKKTKNQASLKKVKSTIQSLEAKHEQQMSDRDTAADAYELKMVQVTEAFTKTDEFENLHLDLNTLMSRHHKASDRLVETTADRDEKRKPYEADKIFSYLLKAAYGTPRYEKKGLIRLCDGWLADFVDYDKAHKNYQLLLAIPDRLVDHIEHLKVDIDKVQHTIDDCIEKRFSKSGGLPLQERLDRYEHELQGTIERLSEKREQAIALQNVVADSEAGIDELTRQAFGLQRRALEAEPITDLWRRAHETETKRDDRMVESIGELREQLQDIESDISKGKQRISDLQKRLTDVNSLLQEFQRRDWDSSYSNFTNTVRVNDLVQDLAEGNIDGDQALRQLAKAQRFTYRHSKGGWTNSADVLLRELQRSTHFPMSRSRPGGFGGFGGGFRGGGGFGGGGFRTGGGF